MKTISEKELKVLNDVIDFLEHYSDYYYDVEDPETDVVRMRNALPTLKNIINGKDFKPKTKVVEKVIEKETISENELNNIISSAERHARERIDPLFKYCVCKNNLSGTLYLTDNYTKALEKAKSLSSSSKDYSFWDIFSIKKINDGSYKLFKEGYYVMGEFDKHNYTDKEFLHFDYIRNLFEKIEKI